MKQPISAALLVALVLLVAAPLTVPGQDSMNTATAQLSAPSPRDTLQDLVNGAARTALEKFKDKGLKEENLSITLIDLRDSAHPAQASFRGTERVYPASVVKLFYL